MTDESMRKYLVPMCALIHELASVREPTRASPFGTIPLERFFSCWRRVAHVDYPFAT
jgi:hypothetical protein